MALPSQSGRPSARSVTRSHRRNRLTRRLSVGALLAVAAVSLGIWWASGSGDDTPAAKDEPRAGRGADGNGVAAALTAIEDPADVAEESVEQPPHTKTEPPRITMGGAVPPNSTPVDVELDNTEDQDRAATALAMPEPQLPEVETTPRPDPTPVRLGAAPGDPLQKRRQLSRLLDTGLERAEAERVRAELTRLNEYLVFSPEIVSGDPFCISYTIEGGDVLTRIVRCMGLNVEWMFIQRINGIPAPEKIRPGQRIKLVTGSFHAVIHKSDFRLDLYLGDGADRVYVRSFFVGLGEFNSTPEGLFRIKPKTKTVNPGWVNPRTRQGFDRDDPSNPIGEHWLGLEPLDEAIAELTSYGIHGTIEPDSIGQQRSMGCIRLLPNDVELVYEMMAEGVSTVEVVR